MNDARGAAHKSRTHRLLGPHKQAEGWNVLALSNGRWKLLDEQFGAFLEHYVADLPRFNLGLVVKKSEYFPYIMDVDKSATKGASVGTPMEVLKVVVRALKSVVGETRMLFEHRNSAKFHVLCPDIIVDSRTAVRIREKQLVVLTSKYSEVDWNDIVDERVLTSNGLRLLGSLKFKEISGARDRTKRYKEVEADIAGGYYVPCQVDLESGDVTDEAITYEALSARLLHRPELSDTELFQLHCECFEESETYKYLTDFKITRPTCMTLTTEDKTGWRIEDTAVRQGFYKKYLTEAEQFDFTFREHGLRVHPLVVQVDLSHHPEPNRFDLLRTLMANLGGILNPRRFGKPLVLHAQQTRYCFVFKDVPVANTMAGAVRRHLVHSLNKTVGGGHRSWENDIAGNEPGGAPLMGTFCSPMLGRWRPIEVDWKARTMTPLEIGVHKMMQHTLIHEGEQPAEIEELHTGASEEIETPDGALSVAAMRSLLDLLHKERWDVYSQWMQLKFALKTSGGEAYRDLFIEQSRKSPKFDQCEVERKWDEVQDTNGRAPVTIGTIIHCAKVDNYEGCLAWKMAQVVGREREWTEDPTKAQRVRAALEACIRKKGSDVSIAKLFQAMFPGVYKWCGENKSTIPYFRFNGTYWQQHKSTAGVMTLLSDVLAPEFEAEATKSFMEAKEKEESDKEKAKADEARGHRAAKVALDLENNSHRECAVKEIANLYHEEGFSGKLDQAENLLCFENGVYDLSTGQYRPGVPEDNLSMSTGYDFVAEGGGHRATVEEYFRRVYPDNETRDYMLRSYAQMLNGRMMKRVFVHTGPFGDNGKSTTFEFLKVIFGRYGKTMPIKYLTNVRPDAGKADSVLMGLKGARFAAMEEPDNNAYINGALACELTGGSKISGRDLFCANVEYRPQFVPHLACNKLPGIDNDNGGARTRMRKCDYVSRFVLGGEVDEDSHVYPADPQINLRFSEWAMDAMLLLLSMYEHVYVEHCPTSIQESTEDYMDDGNVMALFAKIFIKRVTKEDHFKLKEAEAKWSDFVTAVERQEIEVKFRDLTKPSKEGFRQGLQTVLKTACPKDPRPIGGKNHKSAFRGWVLLEEAIELNK